MLRVYRLVPKSYRLRLVRLLPPHRQLWLIRRLTQLRPARRPAWLERKNAALAALGRNQINRIAADRSRFLSSDELRYSLRSIAAYAPWVRHIHLVTDDQVPSWLGTADPRITVVSHRVTLRGASEVPA